MGLNAFFDKFWCIVYALSLMIMESELWMKSPESTDGCPENAMISSSQPCTVMSPEI
jgi:hypothetical protein